MKGKKQRNLMKWLIVLVISFIPILVYADMGPKPSTTIKIVNPPKGFYCIDLLMEIEPERDWQIVVPETCNEAEKELLEVMLDYEDEKGWKPRFSVLLNGHGDNSKNIKDTYTYSYMDVPEEFKIIIVTQDKQVHVSPVIHKHAFEETMTYDYAAGKVRQKVIAMAYFFQFLITCIPTLCIEGYFLMVFGFESEADKKVFLYTNIGTQLLMTIIITPILLHGGYFLGYLILIPLEVVITIIESVIYVFKLEEWGKGRRIAYAILANFLSTVAGFFGFVFQYSVVNL